MSNPSHDRSARFKSLVLVPHVRIRAFVRSLGVEPDWVDDVAHEAFVNAYNDRDSFDQSRDFGKWVRGIAANIVPPSLRQAAASKGNTSRNLAAMFDTMNTEVSA
jgi:RNA polymerase sigma-70 factor (ECF subfamily)